MGKHANIMAAEAQISDKIRGQQRYLVGYELLRVYFGQEVNRYPRLRVPWDKCDHEAIHKEGQFYSALARFIIANPQYSDQCNKERIERVASSWVVGTELTVDQVLGPQPVEGGITIGNFSQEQPDGDEQTVTPSSGNREGGQGTGTTSTPETPTRRGSNPGSSSKQQGIVVPASHKRSHRERVRKSNAKDMI